MNTKRKTFHMNFFSLAGALLFALLALGHGYFVLTKLLTVISPLIDGSIAYLSNSMVTISFIVSLLNAIVHLFATGVMGLMAVAMLLGRKNKFLCLCTALLVVERIVALSITPIYWLLLRSYGAHMNGQGIFTWLLSFVGIVAPVSLTLFIFLTCFSKKERNIKWAKFVFFLPALVYVIFGLLGIPVIIGGMQSVTNMIQMSGTLIIILMTVLDVIVSLSNFYVLFLAYLALGAWVAFPKRNKVAKGAAEATCEAFYVESNEEPQSGDPS